MARSLSHAGRLFTALSYGAGLILARRSYLAAVAPSAAVKKAEEKAAASTKGKKAAGAATEPSPAASSWVPDPVTGYYRPANRMAELDAAELRRRLLSRRSYH